MPEKTNLLGQIVMVKKQDCPPKTKLYGISAVSVLVLMPKNTPLVKKKPDGSAKPVWINPYEEERKRRLTLSGRVD